MIRRLVLATAVASSLFAVVPTTASAQTYVRIAPPPPQVEVVPAPRRGMAWAPGHWEWHRQRYVWVAGSWVRERPGYAYAGPQWRERGGRWYMEPGHWRRGDRDGDGVPNRADRRPNDPNRR